MPPKPSETDALQTAIETSNSEALVPILEQRIKAGVATESEVLLCGVSLLFPPFVDVQAASQTFCRLFDATRGFEAAVWDAYRFAILQPEGDQPFQEILRTRPTSAVGAHLLSLVERAQGNFELALQANRHSRSIRLFPFNIVEGLKRDSNLTAAERAGLLRSLQDLVTCRSAESGKPLNSVEGMLQRYWDNLILGTRITSALWDHYQKAFFRRT